MRILFCGLSGIPNQTSASINRYMAIGQSLASNHEIIFINRFPLFKEMKHQPSESSTSFTVIDATNTKYRPDSFLKRNLIKLTSFIFEYRVIRKIHQEKKIDWLNVYTQYFGIVLLLFLLKRVYYNLPHYHQ